MKENKIPIVKFDLTLPTLDEYFEGHQRPDIEVQSSDAPGFGDEKQPLFLPRPQLQCPECTFENDNPEHLAEHLIQAHSYITSTAWYATGQENERLYPRFRAPVGNIQRVCRG